MKIVDFKTTKINHLVRVSATVIWENLDRPAQEVYFETTAEYEEEIFCNPNSFLLACTLPAMRYGESRIAIDAPICPELKEGLITAMHCLISWHGGDRKVIPIEAEIQSQQLFPDKSPRAGCFFSGGIDSLSMLRNNHLRFNKEHTRHIKDGILVYGALQGEDKFDPNFQNVIDTVSLIADDAVINLIPVFTNAYVHFSDLDSNANFWRFEYHGSFLSAIAHAFVRRLTTASIASTYDLANLEPWGSHPLIDPLYSNSNLQIRHEEAALSRLNKTKIVAEWDIALKNLRVCNHKASYSKVNYNCGQCEKCVRTMLALSALGKLQHSETFVNKELSKELLLQACYLGDDYEESCYRELINPIQEIGRDDLADAIQKIIIRYQEKDLKGIIKRLDRAAFNGNLFNLAKPIIPN